MRYKLLIIVSTHNGGIHSRIVSFDTKAYANEACAAFREQHANAYHAMEVIKLYASE